jgi:hypothetical protein
MKLLAPKGFLQFEPEEFHSYVKSLNRPRTSGAEKKAQSERKVRVKRKKKGGLSVVTSRRPKYITESEISAISANPSLNISKEALTNHLISMGFKIVSAC